MKGDGSLRSKISRGLLLEHAGRERAVGLAVLDPLVEDVLHVGAARIGDDRPVAERARAELHPPLEPADDLARRRWPRRPRGRGRASSRRRTSMPASQPLPRALSIAACDLGVVERGARVGVLHDEPARAAAARRARRRTRRRCRCRRRRRPAARRPRGTASARRSCRWRPS